METAAGKPAKPGAAKASSGTPAALHQVGLFISFEGIDGAGKSTHIDALAQAFRAQGRAVVLTREPGGTALAEKLRALVLNDAMDPLTESLLIFAARRDHIVQVIRPALERGEVVLCDRFTDATFAYQGGGRGFDRHVLATLEAWVQASLGGGDAGLLQPHLTLWFDLPAQAAAERLKDTRVPDRFESQPVEFFRRVAAGYQRRKTQDPGRFARIDAAAERQQVWKEVLRAVQGRGWLP
jgi:dTMP kinase